MTMSMDAPPPDSDPNLSPAQSPARRPRATPRPFDQRHAEGSESEREGEEGGCGRLFCKKCCLEDEVRCVSSWFVQCEGIDEGVGDL